MRKKILSLILSFCFILPFFSVPGGAESVYIDINGDEWYAQAVEYVTENGLMVGIGDGTFAPDTTLTRAMFVTVLYRMAETPEYDGISFDDVKEETWYYDAVNWAASEKIVLGFGDGSFMPNEIITREQIAVMIIRFSSAMGYDNPENEVFSFEDEWEISSWAYYDVMAARSAGYINGKPGNIFDPKSGVTRAEAAQIIKNLKDNVIIPQPAPAPDYRPIVTAYYDAQNMGGSLSSIRDSDLLSYDIIYYTGYDIYNVAVNWLDIRPKRNMTNKAEIEQAKEKNPDLKILMSLYAAPKNFNAMTVDDETLSYTVKKLVDKIEEIGFDGVDVDWEFPENGYDKLCTARLFTAIREELDSREESARKHYYLTAAIPPAYGHYDYDVLFEKCDYINIMSYDYHSGSIYTLHHTSPYGQASIIGNIYDGKYFGKYSAKKVLFGCGLYSQTWYQVVDNGNNGLYSYSLSGPSNRNAVALRYKDLDFSLGYSFHHIYWDDDCKAAYLYENGTFISIDTDDSVKEKVKICYDYHLGGVMLYTYSTFFGNTLSVSIKNWADGDFDYPNAVDWRYGEYYGDEEDE